MLSHPQRLHALSSVHPPVHGHFGVDGFYTSSLVGAPSTLRPMRWRLLLSAEHGCEAMAADSEEGTLVRIGARRFEPLTLALNPKSEVPSDLAAAPQRRTRLRGIGASPNPNP